jgi:hypothetical protein
LARAIAMPSRVRSRIKSAFSRFFGSFSWKGHQFWYEKVQQDLADEIAAAKALGCPYNPEADKMVSMPYPDAPVKWLGGPH